MENLSKEELSIVCEAMKERYTALSDITRKGLTTKIRATAQVEADETGKVWGKVEQALIKKTK